MLKRREFLAASCLAATVPLQQWAKAAEAEKPAGPKQYFELRHYTFASPEKREVFNTFLKEAAIPAWNRLGIRPIGAFTPAESEIVELWVLLPHESLDSVATANSRIVQDAAYLEAGKVVLEGPKDDPVYQRFTSSLLRGFDQCPRLETPPTGAARVFQLRIYESHNTVMAKRKIEMFNEGGEIALFREAGLQPVFFGESLVGDKMPNLTYMVGFKDDQTRQAAWSAFSNSDGWKKLKSDPRYKDTVSKVNNIPVLPAPPSQI